MKMWILLAFVLTVNAVWGCPKDVMRGVNECMGPLESYTVDPNSILELMSRPDKTSQLCRDGKIQTAFLCLNELYNTCLRPRDHIHQLDLIIDVGRWSQAMANICNNIQYFKDHEECERQANLEYRPCADGEMAKVSQRISAVWTPRSTPTVVNQELKMDAVMKLLCHFSDKIRECLRGPYDKFCPAPLTNLLVSTIENFMPPACIKRARTNNTKDSQTYNHDGPYDEIEIIFGSSKSRKYNERNMKSDDKSRGAKLSGKSGKKEAHESRHSKGGRNNGSSQFKDTRIKIATYVILFISFRFM